MCAWRIERIGCGHYGPHVAMSLGPFGDLYIQSEHAGHGVGLLTHAQGPAQIHEPAGKDHVVIRSIYAEAETFEIHLSTLSLNDLPPAAKDTWLAEALNARSRWGTAVWR